MFHSVAAEESSNLRPYLTVLILFGTSDVVEADLSDLGGWYQFNSSHWYDVYVHVWLAQFHLFFMISVLSSFDSSAIVMIPALSYTDGAL